MKREALIWDRGVEFSVQNGESLLRLEIGERLFLSTHSDFCISDVPQIGFFFHPKEKATGLKLSV